MESLTRALHQVRVHHQMAPFRSLGKYMYVCPYSSLEVMVCQTMVRLNVDLYSHKINVHGYSCVSLCFNGFEVHVSKTDHFKEKTNSPVNTTGDRFSLSCVALYVWFDPASWAVSVAQLVEHVPRMQNVADSSTAWGSSFFFEMTVLGELYCVVLYSCLGSLLVWFMCVSLLGCRFWTGCCSV